METSCFNFVDFSRDKRKPPCDDRPFLLHTIKTYLAIYSYVYRSQTQFDMVVIIIIMMMMKGNTNREVRLNFKSKILHFKNESTNACTKAYLRYVHSPHFMPELIVDQLKNHQKVTDTKEVSAANHLSELL